MFQDPFGFSVFIHCNCSLIDILKLSFENGLGSCLRLLLTFALMVWLLRRQWAVGYAILAGCGFLAASFWMRGADAQERLSARDRDDPRIDPTGTPGWGRVGGRLDYRGPGAWHFSLTADNLTDKRYRVHGSGIDAPGRRVALTIRRSFGAQGDPR